MPSRARGAASRASTCLNNALDALFERRNPAFVTIYLVLFSLAFLGYTVLFFSLLPLPGAPFWHVYTGSAAAVASLVLYVRACRSDPGVITRANVDRHSSSFARDGVLYSPRTCGTCHISKPARSKHCRICDRCVARMDHHCFFINNCVGQRNHRLFLAFLASTASLCAYGALLGKRILTADMTASGAWALARLRRGQMVYVSDSWRECLSYTFARYPRQVLLIAFLGVIGYTIFGFLGYQVYLAAAGMTGNEAGKWRELRRDLRRQAAFDRGVAAEIDLMPRNAYDAGIVANLAEVLFPAGRDGCAKCD